MLSSFALETAFFKFSFAAAMPLTLSHVSNACFWFSDFVTYSRFSSRLSVLIPFLWFTSRAEGQRNASIISLWTRNFLVFPSFESL